MKNIISKILDIIAFCIRITTVTILTFITAIVILSCIPIFIVLLCNTKLYMFILLTFLVIWAFLRKKKDIFTCPNEKNVKQYVTLDMLVMVVHIVMR